MIPLQRQLHIEFGLVSPISIQLLGLPFASWTYERTLEMERLEMEGRHSDRGSIMLACALDLPDLSYDARLNLISAFPRSILAELITVYLQFYPSYDKLYQYVQASTSRISYLASAPSPPNNFFVTSIIDLIRRENRTEQQHGLERMLGVRWTPEMLFPKPNEDGSVAVERNEYYQPLAVSLAQNPTAMMKHIRGQVKKLDPDYNGEEDAGDGRFRQPPSEKASQPGNADAATIGNKLEPKYVYVKRDGEACISLIHMGKEGFKDLFRSIDLNPRA